MVVLLRAVHHSIHIHIQRNVIQPRYTHRCVFSYRRRRRRRSIGTFWSYIVPVCATVNQSVCGVAFIQLKPLIVLRIRARLCQFFPVFFCLLSICDGFTIYFNFSNVCSFDYRALLKFIVASAYRFFEQKCRDNSIVATFCGSSALFSYCSFQYNELWFSESTLELIKIEKREEKNRENSIQCRESRRVKIDLGDRQILSHCRGAFVCQCGSNAVCADSCFADNNKGITNTEENQHSHFGRQCMYSTDSNDSTVRDIKYHVFNSAIKIQRVAVRFFFFSLFSCFTFFCWPACCERFSAVLNGIAVLLHKFHYYCLLLLM